MIYLYMYYSIVIAFVATAIYALITEWKGVNLSGKLVAITFSVFAAATAGMIGLLHSWTGDGFSYIIAVLRQLGVPI